MDVLTNQRHEVEDRHVFSIVEEYNLETGERKVLKDNKLNLYYVIAELPDDIDEILLDDTWDV